MHCRNTYPIVKHIIKIRKRTETAITFKITLDSYCIQKCKCNTLLKKWCVYKHSKNAVLQGKN